MEVAELGVYELCKIISVNGNKKLDVKAIGSYFIELGTVLYHFMQTYNFFHRDLHIGNVLFHCMGDRSIIDNAFKILDNSASSKEDVLASIQTIQEMSSSGEIAVKLIDFGMACITIDGVQYSLYNNQCKSYDLLIYTISFLEGIYMKYQKFFSQSMNILLNNLVTSSSTGKVSINVYLKLNRIREKALEAYLQTEQSKLEEAKALAEGKPYIPIPKTNKYRRYLFHYVYMNYMLLYKGTIWALPYDPRGGTTTLLEELGADHFFDRFLPNLFANFWIEAYNEAVAVDELEAAKAMISSAGGRRKLSRRKKRKLRRKTRRTK